MGDPCDPPMTIPPPLRSTSTRRVAGRGAVLVSSVAIGLALSTTRVLAHASSLDSSRESMTIPAWLVLLTGGAVIGASFLLVSMLTDRAFIDRLNRWGPSVATRTPAIAIYGSRLVGVVTLAVIISVGFAGPQTSTASLTVLFVWALWWAGYTMSVYLLGNSWPLLNPWRFLADVVPISGDRSYPASLGSWPSVIGLFALVWVEVTTPITDQPRLLGTVIAGYTALTVTGALVFGSATWFARADPISRVFRFFGSVAPVQRTETGLEIGLPGWRLRTDHPVEDWGDVAFVLGLLWLTTYDGFVATPAWESLATPLVSIGIPPLVVYFGLLLGGFGLFVGAYVIATRSAKALANTALSTETLAFTFAGTLLPIAAGYHLAHYLGYFIHFLPTTLYLSGSPLSPPAQLPVIAIPGWFGTLQLVFVLVGHIVAIWAAHGVAFETFTGRLQPIRSQYPYSMVMVVYTIVSIGIVYQPSIAPPFL
jgi:hypothetical protein